MAQTHSAQCNISQNVHNVVVVVFLSLRLVTELNQINSLAL